MQKLLSLPPNLVQSFHELERVNRTDWFCTSDPVGKKLGSGGGTSWLLEECYNEYSDGATFGEWLEKEKEFFFMRVGKAVVYPAMHLLKDSHSGSCVPVGERATSGTKSAFSATSPI